MNSQELYKKDAKTGAFINTDDSALIAFRNAREEAKTTKHVLSELAHIKSELQEVKMFTQQILSILKDRPE